jgi:hypothetical protein
MQHSLDFSKLNSDLSDQSSTATSIKYRRNESYSPDFLTSELQSISIDLERSTHHPQYPPGLPIPIEHISEDYVRRTPGPRNINNDNNFVGAFDHHISMPSIDRDSPLSNLIKSSLESTQSERRNSGGQSLFHDDMDTFFSRPHDPPGLQNIKNEFASTSSINHQIPRSLSESSFVQNSQHTFDNSSNGLGLVHSLGYPTQHNNANLGNNRTKLYVNPNSNSPEKNYRNSNSPTQSDYYYDTRSNPSPYYHSGGTSTTRGLVDPPNNRGMIDNSSSSYYGNNLNRNDLQHSNYYPSSSGGGGHEYRSSNNSVHSHTSGYSSSSSYSALQSNNNNSMNYGNQSNSRFLPMDNSAYDSDSERSFHTAISYGSTNNGRYKTYSPSIRMETASDNGSERSLSSSSHSMVSGNPHATNVIHHHHYYYNPREAMPLPHHPVPASQLYAPPSNVATASQGVMRGYNKQSSSSAYGYHSNSSSHSGGQVVDHHYILDDDLRGYRLSDIHGTLSSSQGLQNTSTANRGYPAMNNNSNRMPPKIVQKFDSRALANMNEQMIDYSNNNVQKHNNKSNNKANNQVSVKPTSVSNVNNATKNQDNNTNKTEVIQNTTESIKLKEIHQQFLKTLKQIENSESLDNAIAYAVGEIPNLPDDCKCKAYLDLSDMLKRTGAYYEV